MYPARDQPTHRRPRLFGHALLHTAGFAPRPAPRMGGRLAPIAAFRDEGREGAGSRREGRGTLLGSLGHSRDRVRTRSTKRSAQSRSEDAARRPPKTPTAVPTTEST